MVDPPSEGFPGRPSSRKGQKTTSLFPRAGGRIPEGVAHFLAEGVSNDVPEQTHVIRAGLWDHSGFIRTSVIQVGIPSLNGGVVFGKTFFLVSQIRGFHFPQTYPIRGVCV